MDASNKDNLTPQEELAYKELMHKRMRSIDVSVKVIMWIIIIKSVAAFLWIVHVYDKFDYIYLY